MANKKITTQVMIKLLSRDDEGVAHYMWRRCDDQGRWLGEAQQGDIELLQTLLPGNHVEVCLVLSGTDVVLQDVPFNTKERRHLARMIPFELEDELTSEIDELHFALAAPSDDAVTTAYVDNDWLAQQITELEAVNFEVSHCIPEPLLLPHTAGSWTLHLSNQQLMMRQDENLGFTVEESLAAVSIEALSQSAATPENLLLLAPNEEQLNTLYGLIPPHLEQNIIAEQIESRLADYWQSISFQNAPLLDLRQGRYARQFPYMKWWQQWRSVAAVALVSLVAYLGVSIGQIQIANSQQKELRQQINDTYRQVVPQGAVANAEQQLKQKIAQFEGSGGGGSVVALLAKIAPIIAENDDVNLRDLRYVDQSGEMQLTLQAKNYDTISKLESAIKKSGLEAKLLNTSRAGDEQQARMVVSRAGI
ncbi:type II secretion system protein GspL [Aurantivibrio infirmus]